MLEELDKVEQEALETLTAARSKQDLQLWRSRHLGRKSRLKGLFSGLGRLPKEEKPVFGKRAHAIRKRLEESLDARHKELDRAEVEASLAAEAIDVTLPGRPVRRGRLHVTTQTLRRIYAIWAEMGFQVYRSRDVESDEYNFQLLNFPRHHPAREMQDTFHATTEDVLLRTHTSPGQMRVMREHAFDPDGRPRRNPDPIRVILPGMCYRYEQITARSEIQFNQVEGLAVGRRIRMSDLKGTLSDFARRMFGHRTRTRFRCSHFPFTEPSAEMDIECFLCRGEGCRVCKHTGWLEILGCGQVHPVVLQNGGYDPSRYSGFAFGMGPERIAMLRYGIEDIRHFWANDLRFLEQF